ncbi:MAG TPA: hypothetical protein VFA63_05915 [Pseudonocardiaceae bacterium]|nr:hypothetical protein [Pseudonocardiaceae bacterium]
MQLTLSPSGLRERRAYWSWRPHVLPVAVFACLVTALTAGDGTAALRGWPR